MAVLTVRSLSGKVSSNLHCAVYIYIQQMHSVRQANWSICCCRFWWGVTGNICCQPVHVNWLYHLMYRYYSTLHVCTYVCMQWIVVPSVSALVCMGEHLPSSIHIVYMCVWTYVWVQIWSIWCCLSVSTAVCGCNGRGYCFTTVDEDGSWMHNCNCSYPYYGEHCQNGRMKCT